MAALTRCAECDEEAEPLYDDPRDPPMEYEDCLCRDCAIEALEYRIQELEDGLEILRSTKCELEQAKGEAK